MDLVLSSGFLAFARHLGVLDAVEDAQICPEAVVGTSSGALVGALWTAGHPLDAIAEELSRPPLFTVRPSLAPWRGALSLSAAARRLEAWLPARLEDLPRPLAVGVVTEGTHTLRSKGPLIPTVLASCAMPYVFAPVRIDGRPFSDGGAADRLGLDAWRAWRPGRTALAHEVARTAGQDVEADLTGVRVIRTPRSGAKLWSLGDFEAQRREARAIAARTLADNPP